ncbi:tetratricopeptide repeat protein [bacterium]|nr:tetratricopeptide repeat protein [bacterium]
MAIQILNSPRELSGIIKECGNEGTLLVIFDSTASQSYPKFSAAVESLLGKYPLLKAVLMDIEKPEAAMLANQMRLSALPTTVVIKGGETVDQLEGLFDEASLEKALSAYLPPKPAGETLQEEYDQAVANGENQRALALLPILRAEKKDDRNLWLSHIRLLLQNGQAGEARKIAEEMESPSLLAEKTNLSLLFREISETESSGNEAWDEIRALLKEAKFPEAVESLLEFVARDRKFGDDLARKILLGLFALLGDNDPFVLRSRARLANLLFV